MSEEMVKVTVLMDSKRWHGKTAELLWATPLLDGAYRLENSPLYARNLSYKDIVRAEKQQDGSLIFADVVGRAGHSTYQILLNDGIARARFDGFWSDLEKLGCSYESSKDPENVFSVDVPPDTDVYAVYAILEKGHADGIWDFSEGHCGHQLRQ